ncbi:hypothetical protein [uncultured Desulfovibrio sp.]|uniref:hypothetical protein n=1 Tax=uncultured Desulfovibrio sp. TaxID=167968 RepID=UPI002615B2A4|nr:hypothetical protein [uncultured Desulfovibrio sp.]
MDISFQNAKRQKRQKGKRHFAIATRLAPKYQQGISEIRATLALDISNSTAAMPHIP